MTPLRPRRRPLDVDDPPEFIWAPHLALVRVYHEHPHRPSLRPRTWGPVARFDPQVRDRHGRPREQPDSRGVIYLADELECALAEAFADQPHQVHVCPRARAVLGHPLGHTRLLDLTGAGAMRIGAVGTLAWGDEPRRLTQRWGRAIYEDLPRMHGIRYRSAHQGGLAVAAWERSAPLREVPDSDRALLDSGMRDRVTVALAAQGRVLVEIGRDDCASCRDAAAAAA